MMRLLTDLQELFFPRTCIVCGKILLPSEHAVCTGCLAALPFTGFHSTPSDNPIARSFWGKLPVEKATSYFYYHKGGAASCLLRALKYNGRKDIGYVLGRYAACELQPSGFFSGIDFLVPVPLHPLRERKRGYNQSREIARGISSIVQIPLLETCLSRCHNNLTQTHKSSFERWQNTVGLFTDTPFSASLKDKHILLIDDVLTTGATLVACADALSGIPGLRISLFTLAWAQ